MKPTKTRAMLTTVDNPWSPFTHYDEWLAFDRSHGYFTTSLLARVTKSSFDISDEQYHHAVQEAIDEIVRVNPTGKHRKVYE